LRVERQTKVKTHERAVRVCSRESPQALDGALRPGCDGCPDGRLEGRRSCCEDRFEPAARLFSPALLIRPFGRGQGTALRVVSWEEGKLKRRRTDGLALGRYTH
jgi:hypothetical protein